MTVGEELLGPRRHLDLLETAAAVGALRKAELDLFALLGSKAADLPDTQAPWAASASRRAAWRAEQLSSLLPVSRGLPDADDSTQPAGPAYADCMEALLRARGEELAGEVLVFYGVLGSVYDDRARFVGLAADGQLGIVLARVSGDLRGDEALLRSLLVGHGGVA